MKSLINIERTAQVIVASTTFTSNWLIENNCETTRAQLMTFNEFYGELQITGLTVSAHEGAAKNTYLTGGGSNLAIPVSLTGVRALASKTPLFRFGS
jgi:hypothetical protein